MPQKVEKLKSLVRGSLLSSCIEADLIRVMCTWVQRPKGSQRVNDYNDDDDNYDDNDDDDVDDDDNDDDDDDRNDDNGDDDHAASGDDDDNGDGR